MDRKTVRKKLIKNTFSKTASIVLAALTVVFLVLGFSNQQADKGEAKSLADNKAVNGAYAYLDAAAFDEWVCRSGDETYYVVFDSSGSTYLAAISDRTMKSMIKAESGTDDYRHFFEGSYRLYGLVKIVSRSVSSIVEDAYGISRSEYMEYFGSYYFDTTSNPNTNTAWMWWTFAMFSGMFAIIFFIIWIGSERPFNRETRDYTEDEYAEASWMMDETDKKQKLIWGDRLIIGRDSGMLVRYQDILWVHFVNVFFNGVNLGKMVRIHTLRRNSYKLKPAVKDSQQDLDDLMNVIIEKNPGILIGYTPENRKAYDSMTRSRS